MAPLKFMLILMLLSSGVADAQNFQELNAYVPFAVSVQGLAYAKGNYTNTEGNYSPDPRFMLSGQAGVRYIVFNSGPWGFSTGLFLGWPPVYNQKVSIQEKDLFGTADDGTYVDDKAYSTYSVVIPLAVEYKRQLRSKKFLAVSAGVQGMWLSIGHAESSYVIESEGIAREVFMMEASNSEPGYYYSAQIGIGNYIASRVGLFYLGLEYSKSFQTLMNGRYVYGNLKSSPESRGTYKFSGDYLALTMRYSWKRKVS